MDRAVGVDPDCRWQHAAAERGLSHTCVTESGRPVRPGESCCYEQSARVIDERRRESAAESAVGIGL
jgi:hypothetical protein